MIYWLRWSSAVVGKSVWRSYCGDDRDGGGTESDLPTVGDFAMCMDVYGSFALSLPFPIILAFCWIEGVCEGDKMVGLRNAVEAGGGEDTEVDWLAKTRQSGVDETAGLVPCAVIFFSSVLIS